MKKSCVTFGAVRHVTYECVMIDVTLWCCHPAAWCFIFDFSIFDSLAIL